MVGIRDDSKYVNKLLLGLFGIEVLKESSVYGVACRSSNGNKEKPKKLDEKRVKLIRGTFKIIISVFFQKSLLATLFRNLIFD
jgi:hypothetical protein